MPEKIMERMNEELAQWRTRLDQIRVKGDLAKKDLRDKADDFRRAYWRAKGRIDVMRELHAERWSAACEALEKGWDEIRDTYRKERQRHRDER